MTVYGRSFYGPAIDCRQVRDIYYVKALEMYGHRDIIGGAVAQLTDQVSRSGSSFLL